MLKTNDLLIYLLSLGKIRKPPAVSSDLSQSFGLVHTSSSRSSTLRQLRTLSLSWKRGKPEFRFSHREKPMSQFFFVFYCLSLTYPPLPLFLSIPPLESVGNSINNSLFAKLLICDRRLAFPVGKFLSIRGEAFRLFLQHWLMPHRLCIITLFRRLFFPCLPS